MSSVIESARIYVYEIINKNQDDGFLYHNSEHTKAVVKVALEIADSEKECSNASKENIELAALFHDVAYYKGRKNHEENGVEIARTFLMDYNVSEDQLQEIERIILATKLPHSPTDLLEQIIQDADMSHLGNEDYMETTFVTLEDEMMNKSDDFKEVNWLDMCIMFIEKHEYQTNYAKEHFNPIKKQNLNKLYKMKEEDQTTPVEIIDTEVLVNEKKKSKKKPKSDLPEKGVETMFRVALRNHLNLSRIADNKANTLISVNALIISIILGSMFPKIDNNPYLIYPGLTIILFSIVTIIISILSTIPKTSHGVMSREEVLNKEGNLIFFGNFHKMTLEDYEWSISELMKDRDYLYKSLTRDLYFLGKVLNRKYMLLRYSYYVFMIGLITSIVMFALSAGSLGIEA
jgi:predicted metal-dependent HD superfamily phosphohydrolase